MRAANPSNQPSVCTFHGLRWLWGLCGLALACGQPATTTTEANRSDSDPKTESASETTQETSEPTTTGSDTDTESDTGPETGGPVALPTGPLKAGVAVGHLTRPIGVSMAGYGSRTPTTDTPWNNTLNASRGMYGLPSVKAMALEVADERLILLKLPTMSGEASLTDGIADKLEQLYGIDLRGRILTGATHSHHTHARYWRLPDALAVVGCDSPDEEVIDELTTVFAETIKRALDDLQPAHWGYTYRDDWDPDDRIYRDRRNENNPTYTKDPRLTLLAVRRTSGAPMGVIMNFGMHGTVFGSSNELLTEDAPGGIELKFEEYFYQREGQPIFGMFIQSGGADAAPAGDSMGHPEPARIEVIGEEAAPKIYDLYEQITWRAEASLGVQSQRIDLRYDAIGYDESDEFLSPQNRPFLWGGWQCTGSDSDVDDNNPATSMAGKPKDCLDLEGLLTALGQQIPHGEVHQTYLTSAALGNLVLMSLPGEPAASVINYMREELTTRTYQGEPVTGMAFGYSQDHLLYLTHPDDWLQGGYETEMSLWGPLFGQYIVDRQLETVDNLLAGSHTPVWAEESENLSPEPDKPWEPRAYEISLNPGQAVLDPEPVIERGQTLRFGFNGGDASISVPHVVVEVDLGAGVFTPYPAASGWTDAVYDNTRYHMITHYNPDPPPNGKVEPARTHQWWVDWQVPLDFPAAAIRLVARGGYFDGQEVVDYEVTSPAVDIVQASQASLTATLEGDDLVLTLTVLPPAYELEDSWPRSGYRLLDATASPDAPQVVRAPINVRFMPEGEPFGPPVSAVFDPQREAYIVDFKATGLSPENLSVSVNLASDISASAVVTQVG